MDIEVNGWAFALAVQVHRCIEEGGCVLGKLFMRFLVAVFVLKSPVVLPEGFKFGIVGKSTSDANSIQRLADKQQHDG